MDRLQSVSGIRERATYNYAHRVIQIAALHFFFDIDRKLMCCVSHSSTLSLISFAYFSPFLPSPLIEKSGFAPKHNFPKPSCLARLSAASSFDFEGGVSTIVRA
jgi:hypothetical protein